MLLRLASALIILNGLPISIHRPDSYIFVPTIMSPSGVRSNWMVGLNEDNLKPTDRFRIPRSCHLLLH